MFLIIIRVVKSGDIGFQFKEWITDKDNGPKRYIGSWMRLLQFGCVVNKKK